MKIISKYKDYYDYMCHIYGVDDKLVLDRRNSEYSDAIILNPSSTFDKPNKKIHVLHICGKEYKILQVGDKMITGEGLIKYGKPSVKYISYDEKVSYRPDDKGDIIHTDEHGKRFVTLELEENSRMWTRYTVVYIDYDNKPLSVISDFVKPPIYLDTPYYNTNICSYPKLEDFGIPSIISPQEIYILLSDWLAKQIQYSELSEDNRSDIDKLEAKGFDKKSSFRPKSKK